MNQFNVTHENPKFIEKLPRNIGNKLRDTPMEDLPETIEQNETESMKHSQIETKNASVWAFGDSSGDRCSRGRRGDVGTS